ncbi:MAG: hypothetical protein J6S85_15780 [Methanobrevibacter sp.]|nr:hypothetical protein [Methanobrevibacter sp.]
MKDTIKLEEFNRASYLKDNWHYKRFFYKDFNYKILQNAIVRKYNSWGNETYNDLTMMIDTETSKKREDQYEEVEHIDRATGKTYIEKVYKPYDNHVVIWTLSIRLFDIDIATLYGRKPSELIECINMILNVLKGKYTIFYIFNLTYDYTFLRKFFFREFGYPVEQLNVKSHYPIQIKFDNGLILKDALILAQRKLEKWAEDLGVEAQKQVGSWNYNKLRNQDSYISDQELTYAEYDTLSGTQCIDALKKQLHKVLGNMPYTATGILRDELKKLASDNKAKVLFNKIVPSFEDYMFLVSMFHGGYVHGNKEYLESNLLKDVQGYDFASSYIFCLLCCKYPITKFKPLNKQIDGDYIIRNSDDHAFMFTARFADIKLKDENFPMPVLQFSKCKTVNDVTDNGRIIAAQFLELNTNEIDYKLIDKYYTWDKEHSVIFNVKTARKGYLPDWFRDHLYKLFIDKTNLKGIDMIRYQIQKGKLNAGFGLTVQRQDKLMFIEIFEDEIVEKNGIEIEYHDGMYKLDESIPPEEVYLKNIKKRSVFLPYQWGVWTTSYALEHLFELGSCCKLWLYSDTDSVYGIGWNKKLVKKLNYKYRKMNEKAGFKAVHFKDKDYWLGVAETSLEDKYSEFKYMGAKRYCGRCKEDGKLHITVAGVPKSAADCLGDNIINFKKGFVFEGKKTGKKTHNYMFVDDIYIDEFGNETADSVDLSSCDYNLDVVEYHSLEEYLGTPDYVTIPYYSDEGWVSVG